MTSNYNQFGFKQKHSRYMYIPSVMETNEYYRNFHSPINAYFFEIKSAFDRERHSKLFLKLVARGMPVLFLRSW